MASKRMFSNEIISSDAFMSMPLTTQALYFHLCMNADDDGFVDNPKAIMRLIGASEDDIKILLGKRYILAFESGIIVIKHWFIHNWIRQDRLKPTNYQEELSLLVKKENGAYTEKNKSQSNVSQLSVNCQHSIDKNSIDKNSIDKNNNIVAVATKSYLVNSNEFIDHFSKICPSLPQIKAMTDKRKKAINSILKQYGQDKFVEVLKKTEASDFLSGRNGKWGSCNIDWIIKPSNFIKILEGNYDNIRQRETEEQKLNKKYKETYIEKNQYNAKAIKVQKSFEDMKKYKEMFSKKGITQNDNG